MGTPNNCFSHQINNQKKQLYHYPILTMVVKIKALDIHLFINIIIAKY